MASRVVEVVMAWGSIRTSISAGLPAASAVLIARSKAGAN